MRFGGSKSPVLIDVTDPLDLVSRPSSLPGWVRRMASSFLARMFVVTQQTRVFAEPKELLGEW